MKVIQIIDDKIFMVTDKYSKPEGLEHIDKMNETDGEYFYRLATFKEYKQLLDKNCLKDFEFYRIRENIGHGGIIRADLSISSLMLIVKELKDKNMMIVHTLDDGSKSFIVTNCKYERNSSFEFISNCNTDNSDFKYRLAYEYEYEWLLSINAIDTDEYYWLDFLLARDGRTFFYNDHPTAKLLMFKELKDKNMNDRYKITNGSIIITKPKRIDLTLDEAKELLGVLPTVIEEYENDSKQIRMAAIIETIKGLNKHIEELKEELVSLK